MKDKEVHVQHECAAAQGEVQRRVLQKVEIARHWIVLMHARTYARSIDALYAKAGSNQSAARAKVTRRAQPREMAEVVASYNLARGFFIIIAASLFLASEDFLGEERAI